MSAKRCVTLVQIAILLSLVPLFHQSIQPTSAPSQTSPSTPTHTHPEAADRRTQTRCEKLSHTDGLHRLRRPCFVSEWMGVCPLILFCLSLISSFYEMH